MSELTLAAIEQALDKKLTPIKDVMTKMATSEELADINQGLTAVQVTLNKHTSTLDWLATSVKTLLDEKTIAAARLDRLEKWAQQVGEKTGVKIDLDNIVLN